MIKKLNPIMIIIPVVVIAIISAVILVLGKKLDFSSSNNTEVSLTDYYKLPEGEARLVVDLIKSDENAILKDGKTYLPYSAAQKMMPYQVNGKDETEDVPSFIEDGGNLYVALDFIEKWHEMKVDVYENPGRVVIFDENNAEYEYTGVKSDTALREAGDKKEPILKELKEGEKVYLLEGTGNDFTRVFTGDGVTGYIKTSDLDTDNIEHKKYSFDRGKEDAGYTSITRDEPIVLGWHQVTSTAANSSWGTALAKAEGLNVISPTWFGVADSEGEVTSLASKDYVTKLKAINVDVWPLISDFNKDVDYNRLFMSTTTRGNLIKNIIYFIEEYNLDGINIDFEHIKSSYAEGYIEFLRELSIEMRSRKKVLSVDNYIPLEFNAFYNIKEQGIVSDYLCVMAYDEHYSGSPKAGSVSSLSWVKNSIENTVRSAPMKKLIVGLPFYTRLWREAHTGKLTSRALSMDGGLNLVSSNKAKKEWDKEKGQYYAEWKDGKDRMRIWLEEEKSLEAKLKLVEKDKVAGIAFWKLGLERKEAWNSVTDWLR